MKTGELLDKRHRKIVFATWEAESPKAQLYLVHGYAEHFRRYDRFAKCLNEAGYSVHALDLPGHGLSEGQRGHIEQFEDYILTLNWFIESNPNHLPKIPTFLMGHSTGALISAHYCINMQNSIAGLIMASPLTGFSGFFSAAGWAMAKWFGRNDLSRSIPKPLEGKDLTHIRSRWPEYTNDPLRLNTMSPSLFLGMLRWSELLQNNAKLLKSPLLTFYSREDRVVAPDKIASFFQKAGSRDKEIVAFSHAGHELLNDQPEEVMISKILSWLRQHIS